jgi:hypothetical protein
MCLHLASNLSHHKNVLQGLTQYLLGLGTFRLVAYSLSTNRFASRIEERTICSFFAFSGPNTVADEPLAAGEQQFRLLVCQNSAKYSRTTFVVLGGGHN